MHFLDKKYFYLAALILPLGIMNADELEEPNSPSFYSVDYSTDWSVGLRTAYFYPSNSLEREIYEGARFNIELEVRKSIVENWDIWANFTYFNKTGWSVGPHDKTTLQLFPLSLGVNYVYPLNYLLSLYAGLGVNYTWMRLRDNSPVCPSCMEKSRMGFTCKTGVYYQINEKIFADFFVDYLYIPMRLTNVYNVGGFQFGIGIGRQI